MSLRFTAETAVRDNNVTKIQALADFRFFRSVRNETRCAYARGMRTGDLCFEKILIIPGMPTISLVGARDVRCCYCCCDSRLSYYYYYYTFTPSWRITFARRRVSAKLNLTSNRDLVKNANERVIYFERIAAVWRDRTALTFKNGRTAVAVRCITY